jgi:hypothetical protein
MRARSKGWEREDIVTLALLIGLGSSLLCLLSTQAACRNSVQGLLGIGSAAAADLARLHSKHTKV